MKKILVGLPPELIAAVDKEAQNQGISRSEWFRNLIRKELSMPVPPKPRLNPYREIRNV